jgi:hypothetical protein
MKRLFLLFLMTALPACSSLKPVEGNDYPQTRRTANLYKSPSIFGQELSFKK